jgi:hypothetical protein
VVLQRIEPRDYTDQNIVAADAPLGSQTLTACGVESKAVRINAVVDNKQPLARVALL